MAGHARVFICYKKVLSRDDNGQRLLQKNTEAEIFHYLLSQDDTFTPWVDNARIAAGMKWEMEIYRQILASDVLVVLVGPGTSESEWVRREITLAHALGISVVPIGFDLSDEQMAAEAKALGIDDLQWVLTQNIRLNRGTALLAELDEALRAAVAATRDRQRETLAPLWNRRRTPRAKARDDQRWASFELVSGAESISLHVAAGDLARIRNVDVFVNPENDYMQMARFFESHTVSSMLRRRGATIKYGRYQDTIQQELDWQLRERGRPVQAAEVFTTSAGGPGSELARVNKAKAIMHVAAVQAVDAESRVIPYKHPHQIEASVRGVLSAVATLNELDGVFSPPGTDQRAEQERLADRGEGRLESVIFPLFGTGQGGADPAEVIAPMVEGLLGFLSDPDNQACARDLNEVYISAYAQQDVHAVVGALDERLTRMGGA
ncbi:TIR domain-containing protein [Sphaerisporangium sp. TRM90804]|uniref:TIR domain-containing protein n=1 Tax=Sphaerisporangium sp. TRM90804 TaxID=3031113 RepID=UPI0024490EBB|nr:TIR domain-containing protein [Sphaerisporangium sp. TRM90804]MDH2428525.1 TIR domain-containing protein [Sphaerisporangium sp. TRM90804]